MTGIRPLSDALDDAAVRAGINLAEGGLFCQIDIALRPRGAG